MTTIKVFRPRKKTRSKVLFEKREREQFFSWFALLLEAWNRGDAIIKINKECRFPKKSIQGELKLIFRRGWPFIPDFDEENNSVRIRRRR